MLLNLLQNAQQAMQDSGKGKLAEGANGQRGARPRRLEVLDDGPGIPEALQARIFDPFFTTKPPGKGYGPRARDCQRICPPTWGHDCSIFITRRTGLASWWNCRRPKKHGNACSHTNSNRIGRRRPFPRRVSKGGTVSASGSVSPPPRILVVEDEPTVAALIGDVLREEGLEVDVSPDGVKALELAQHSSYDLVICDVRMPGMDGQDFFGALAQAQQPMRDHILFVTGDGVALRTRDFLVRHHLPHVAKPFRVEELCLAVRGLLSGTPSATGPWRNLS